MEAQERTINNAETEAVFSKYVELFQLTPEDLQKIILDVGTGNGEFVTHLRSTLGNHNAYGIEKKQSVSHGVVDGVFESDGLNIPFDPNTFELVTAKHYLPIFFSDPEKSEKAVRELVRVLKPGGRVVADITTLRDADKAIQDFEKGFWGSGKESERVYLIKNKEGTKYFDQILGKLREEGYKVKTNVCRVTYSDEVCDHTVLTIEKPL